MYSRQLDADYGISLWEIEVFGDSTPSCGGGPPPAVCGNGIVETGEACDDGNTVNNDTCSNTCELGSSSGRARDQVSAGAESLKHNPACPQPGAVCGNRIVATGEACSDRNR